MTDHGVDKSWLQKGFSSTLGVSRKIIIFTDLDGTLLDVVYSYHAANEALHSIREQDIPLVICSSKTRAEIEYYQAKIEIAGPFIPENGGAVYIPRGYFSRETEDSINFDENEEGFRIIRLGADYRDLRAALVELRDSGFDVQGFGDMSGPEIALLTKLPEDQAMLAARREFDEPFIFEGTAEETGRMADAIRSKGFDLARGAFFHIFGQSDKGRAVSILIDIYLREFAGILTVALGDSSIDLPMLRIVDVPVMIQKPDGSFDPELERENFQRADGIGPHGWNKAVMKILSSSP
ncbi:MAG: HAD-IIB family hydrolase [Syntrophorhabdaceae bacterium]|nr:HAD-IIB family hydrolase [Syntrophorhabdaceae bacterium]MDD4196760.1 HAD-IIB family hydrolase [Syntrophorhabdaceae bacterium]